MATATALEMESQQGTEKLSELVDQLGDVPLNRIFARPAPGTATEADVIKAHDSLQKRLCELVDGVLIEKPMGTKEAQLATMLAYLLCDYLEENDLGIVFGADGYVRLKLGLVRMPDISFISWDRVPGDELPNEAITSLIPDLAIEVLSASNTKKEMDRKLREYFEAGVRLVWIIEPKSQTAVIHTSPTKARKVGKDQSLSGGEALPGFVLPLKELFARTRRKKRKG